MDTTQFYVQLSRIPQFRKELKYELASINISETQVFCTCVTSGRVEKASLILQLYERANVQPYLPVELHFGKVRQFVFPAVVHFDEEQDIAVIVDGMHRIFAASRKGYTHLIMLKITGPYTLLPGDLITWSRVQVVDTQVPAADKFINFNPHAFTAPYTVTFNGEQFWTDDDPIE